MRVFNSMRDTGKALEENSKKRGKAITDTDIVKAITGAGKGQARQGPLSAQPWSPTLSQQETGGDRDLVAKHQVCRHKEAHEDHEQHDDEEQSVVPDAHAQYPNLGTSTHAQGRHTCWRHRHTRARHTLQTQARSRHTTSDSLSTYYTSTYLM